MINCEIWKVKIVLFFPFVLSLSKDQFDFIELTRRTTFVISGFMFYVYIVKCIDESYYTGHTDNIEKRISEHMLGKISCYTQKRLPIKLVYIQSFEERICAINAERKIKKWIREKKEALIAKDWKLLSLISKTKQ